MSNARCVTCQSELVVWGRLYCQACEPDTTVMSLFDTVPATTLAVSPSQMEVYALVAAGPTCGLDFMRKASTARYGARIKELRDMGIVIGKKRCRCGRHDRTGWSYQLDRQATGPVSVVVKK